MKRLHKKKHRLYTRIIFITSITIAVITILIAGIIYYWSYYRFNTIFEDYIIDEHTKQDYLNRGVKNEWVLGVSAKNIDLVEAVHGGKVAEQVLMQAEKQVKQAQTYREKIDGKYLLYKIEVNIKDGEKIYKYSIVKDIYMEHIRTIISEVIMIVIIVFIVSLIVMRMITGNVATHIRKTSDYLRKIAHRNMDTKIDYDQIYDEDVVELVHSFEYMQNQLKQQAELQDSILQYISHEMKTPIMIIDSYAQSAKAQIYPKGNLDSSLDVISRQVERMNKKIDELLIVTKIDTDYNNEQLSEVNLSQLAQTVYATIVPMNQSKMLHMQISPDLIISGFYSRLQILFENLLINQLKYCKNNIYIRGFQHQDEIIFLFYNDGDEIASDLKEEIFKPFVKGQSGGHGLGLSICKKIAFLHDAELSLITTTTGCLFKLIFPLKKPL